ncbi:MAG: hypothetical protein ACE5HV_13090 [Acidobacteriota bacterium]
MVADEPNGDLERLRSLLALDRLSDTLRDRPAGDLFRSDLEEARMLAQRDPRFAVLVEGLQAASLGGRLAAITCFFDRFSPQELATLSLPPHLSQLRSIYVSSRS